jgi:SAM-dependent methyltransferase
VSEGYSILVFPEGTRSQSKKLGRFHKGAFFLAEELGLDILPMVMNGTGDYIAKGEYLGRKSLITVKFLDRIKQGDASVGGDYRNMTKFVQKLFHEEFEKMLTLWYRHPAYFRDLLIRNYTYKGPVLEWYAKLKLNFEKNYEPIHEMIPLNAKILDLGCGYGFMSYMLGFLSEKRVITGIDYDEEKILLARNNISALPNLNFEQGDVTEFPLEGYDIYLLADVLHYFPEEKQQQLVSAIIGQLNGDGCLIIRDADTGLVKRQRGTALSEFFSRHIGFNKFAYDNVFFTSRKMIAEIVVNNGAELQIVDKTKFNSNIFYIIRKTQQIL